MKNSRILLLVSALLMNSFLVHADEGMWLLSLLKNHTIEEMQAEGFKLTAEDIYSVNQASLKDAVVIFGNGCTGELISAQGLLLTNHHCGYGAIQSHSSVENDYLTDGFWAMSREEELPNPSLSVRFLRYMDDVTGKVLEGISDEMSPVARDAAMKSNINALIASASEEGKYEVTVKPIYYGNEYYIFVYERYDDVRLVGAPPSSIGNFGEDNDNWMWPRHTGDFSMFRIYATPNNQPAAYSPDNIPYTPRRFFEISAEGVEQGDFTMVLGYPGTTRQFLYSGAIRNMTTLSLPMIIDLRTTRLEIMNKHMQQSDMVRIQYASKYRGVSNAWKKWQGAIKGLDRLDAVKKKESLEEDFIQWVEGSEERREQYGHIIPAFEDIYSQLAVTGIMMDLFEEAVMSVELFRHAATLKNLMENDVSQEKIQGFSEGFYKNYHHSIDQETFAAMMKACSDKLNADYHPEFFQQVQQKYKGDFTQYATKVYGKTIFKSQEEENDLINLYGINRDKALRKLSKDPVVQMVDEFFAIFKERVAPQDALLEGSLDTLYKKYVQGLMEFNQEKTFYPDANFTMRLSFGKVEGYVPMDATEYDYYTTLSGIIEKNRLGAADYVIPDKLMDLYNRKDFGTYGVNGTMPVCFTASNHTSGGNSGSPVLDAEGRLIGINFDRNWEGTMSDEMYDPDMCRNISVDIRYILFIIDKYAGAGYLIHEMVVKQ